MTDPFSFIAEQCQIPDSQLQLLNQSRFFLEDLPLQSNSSDSSDSTPPDMSGIVICSPPKESQECFQTPDSSLAVDLNRDTDLLLSAETDLLASSPAGFDLDSNLVPEDSTRVEMDTAVTDILEVNDFNAMISSEESQGSERERERLQVDNVGSEKNENYDRGEHPLPEDELVIPAAGESVAQSPFVTIDDLCSVGEDDLLVVAIRAGWRIPRPRHWGPRGSIMEEN